MKHFTNMHILALSLLVGGVVLGRLEPSLAEQFQDVTPENLSVSGSREKPKSWFEQKRTDFKEWNDTRKANNQKDAADRKARVASEGGGSFLDHLREFNFKNYKFKNPFTGLFSRSEAITPAQQDAVDSIENEVHPAVTREIAQATEGKTSEEVAQAAAPILDNVVTNVVIKVEETLAQTPALDDAEAKIKTGVVTTLRQRLARLNTEAMQAMIRGDITGALSTFFKSIAEVVRTAFNEINTKIQAYRENRAKKAPIRALELDSAHEKYPVDDLSSSPWSGAEEEQ